MLVSEVTRATAALAALGAASSITLIGLVDYLTGTELRVYPLYFLPISWIAWRSGVRITAIAAVFASGIWIAANQLAGLTFSSTAVWSFNAAMHAGSFMLIAILLARLRKSLNRERELARVDPLTGLLNKRAFADRAAHVLAAAGRYRRPITLAYLDLDDFKAVNDQRGHAAGDHVLQRVGAILREGVRDVDVAARMGGDEFVVLLPETALDGARPALERLHSALKEALAAMEPGVGVSIGAVAFDRPPADLDILVGTADRAMYAAKTSGKNRLTIEAADLHLRS
jgi:diguanylate cyclase (GGDEF)-like protein